MRPATPPPLLAAALAAHGLPVEVLEFETSTRTAAEAAAAIGCAVAEIGKSLVFAGKHGGQCMLVVASGADRIDETRLGEVMGEPIRKANADEVRAATGYVIGGVPPFGHATPLTVLVEAKLARLQGIWVAAGTPRTVFPITTQALIRVTGARVVDVAG